MLFLRVKSNYEDPPRWQSRTEQEKFEMFLLAGFALVLLLCTIPTGIGLLIIKLILR